MRWFHCISNVYICSVVFPKTEAKAELPSGQPAHIKSHGIPQGICWVYEALPSVQIGLKVESLVRMAFTKKPAHNKSHGFPQGI